MLSVTHHQTKNLVAELQPDFFLGKRLRFIQCTSVHVPALTVPRLSAFIGYMAGVVKSSGSLSLSGPMYGHA